MSEFTPISTLSDLELQDDRDMVAGYISGSDGTSEPGSDKSRSYWHGWRNGRVDGGHQPKDNHQAVLASAFVGRRSQH